FERAESIEPLSDANRFTLAMAHIALNQHDAARRELERLPPAALHLYWLGRLDAISGDYPASIEMYKRALALNPEFWRAHDGMGLSYQAIRRFHDAESSFRMAMHTSMGRSPWPVYNLGAMSVDLGKYGEAKQLLADALAIDSDFSKAHYQLGRVHEKLDESEEALESYRRAAATADYPEVFYALHRLLKKGGDEAGARAALQTFQRLNGK
ncbi:MAG: tetratricopeptide repeat protein, partial [Bryobacteraceae bacterium]